MRADIDTEMVRVRSGHELFRRTFRPHGKPLGGVLMIHGLGEHLGRHEHVAEFLCRHGLICTGLDLPGHGLSSGKRGHLPNLNLLAQILDDEAAHLRDLLKADLPLGIFAHSMGGFVALEYLPRHTEEYGFAWISSPLIRPSANVHPFLVRIAHAFGHLAPWLSFPFGAHPADLRRPDAETGDARLADPLMHGQVSAVFGTELLKRERDLMSKASELSPEIQFFFTHGTEDRVCSPEFSRALFEALPSRKKQYVPVEGSLHEPLHDDPELVFEEAERWLTSMGFPARPCAAAPTPTRS